MIIQRDRFGRIVSSDGHPPIIFDTNMAISLYNDGHSIRDVSSMLCISCSVLQRYFKKIHISKDKGWKRRGKKLSSEVRKNMSIGIKKRFLDPVERLKLSGENNPFYGKHHKPETIEAMKLKLRLMLSGANNPQWQGGKSYEPYTYEFKGIMRHETYKRDNYKCQSCGVQYKPNSSKLVAHHKDANKKNCGLDNLITLCRSCHGRITMINRWNVEVSSV